MDRVTVVDIGGADINKGYRQIFNHSRFHYITVDLEGAAGVTVNLSDPYKLPFDDGSVDILLSGQMLEHCEFFWLAFAEWVRVLKPDGFIFLIAPSAGRIHLAPVDCYRFYPDAYRALAKYANCQLLEVWRDERGPWQDLVGVFARHALPAIGAPQADQTLVPNQEPPRAPPASAEEEAAGGSRTYAEVLSDLHELLAPRAYLEIGVRGGEYFSLARGPALGIAPDASFQAPPADGSRLLQMTSSDFFDVAADHLGEPPDLIFLNGTHLIESVLNDFMYVERLAAPHALVVVADVTPNHPSQAARTPRTSLWTGDVWKLITVLQQSRPNLYLQTLDASPAGLLLIGGLTAGHAGLWDRHATIVRDCLRMGDPPPAILERQGAITPDLETLARIIAPLSDVAGGGKLKAQRVVAEMRAATPPGRPG